MELAPGLDKWLALALIAPSFITSLITAAFSLGDGSHQLVATHAMPNTFVHVCKVIVFVAMGFAFARCLPLIVLSVVALGLIWRAVG